MLTPQQIIDATFLDSELLLHQAINSGDETKALEIIESFQHYFVRFGHVIGDLKFLNPLKILFRNSFFGGTSQTSISKIFYRRGQKGEVGPIQISPSLYWTSDYGTKFYPNGWLTKEKHLYLNGFDFRNFASEKFDQNKFQILLGEDKTFLYVLDKSKPENIFHRNKEHFQNAIHLAAYRGMVEVVAKLLEKGIPIDLVDGIGKSAVHYAAIQQQREVLNFLKDKGAMMSKPDIFGQRPIDQATPKNNQNFSLDIIEILDDSLDPSKPNPLHNLISQFNSSLEMVKQIRQYARFNPQCVQWKQNGLLTSGLVANERPIPTEPEKLLKTILESRQKFCSLFWEYTKHSAQFRNLNSIQANDIAYLSFLIKGLEFIIQFTTLGLESNCDEVLDTLNLISTISVSISYDLREASYDKIPWANIEYLRYIITQNHIMKANENYIDVNKSMLESCLPDFIQESVPTLQQSLSDIKSVLEANQSTPENISSFYNSKNTTSSKKYIPECKALYQITEPIADFRYLQRLREICNNLEKFDLETENGRRAMLASLQKIGEYAKFSHGSRKLSGAIKSKFDNVPWNDLTQLRDYLTHYLEKKLPGQIKVQVHSNITNLIDNGKQKLNAILEPIKHLKEQTEAIIKKQEEMLVNPHKTKKFYENAGRKRLDEKQKRELMSDLSLSLGTKGIRNKIDGLKKAVSSLETRGEKLETLAELKKSLEEREKELEEAEKIKNSFNSEVISKDSQQEILLLLKGNDIQKKWTKTFEKALSFYPGYSKLSDFKTNLEKGPASETMPTTQQLCTKTVEVIEKLGIILAGDEQTYRKYCMDVATKKNSEIPIYLMSQESLQRFVKNPELQETSDHLILDIEQYLGLLNGKLGDQIDSNKLFRNFIAHSHLLSDTLGPNSTLLKVSTLLDYVIEARLVEELIRIQIDQN